MTDEEREVLQAYQTMQQAMIDKDIVMMRSLVSEDKTFTHMSGKKQTREEFFDEIRTGILNYYRSDIHNPEVTVEADKAILKATVTLRARVYGISGSWTLPVNTHFEKRNGSWIQVNS